MIEIDRAEAAYLRSNGIYVSMANRGKRSRAKTYFLTESAKNMRWHERYVDGTAQN